MARTAASLLRQIARIRAQYGGQAAERKRDLLRALDRRRLATAAGVLRLHETLCFLRAYPDDAATLRLVERMLDRFDRRSDLRRHGEALADSGVAGAPLGYPFYAPTARWLAARCGDRLHVDWELFENGARLRRMLYLLAPYVETPPPDEMPIDLPGWIDRLRGPGETDAAFLVRWFAGAEIDDDLRDWLYEELELPLRIEPGPGAPSRTRAKLPTRRIHWQRTPLDRRRPDLRRAALQRPASVEDVPPRRAGRLIDLAREAMATRSRDLDVFAGADRRDVRMVDWGDGQQFAVMGVEPRGRYLLESVYGFLTLKNGVPIGYVLASALFGSSEIAYNVFETYRGAEAALIYGRVLATARHLFGSDAFTIDPYQLGHGNSEALESGAWWFYRKLGFRPLDPKVARLMRREERRMQADPAHRSSIATLEELSSRHVFFQLGRFRRDVLILLPLPNVGLAVTGYLARRFGSDRAAARETCSREAAQLLGARRPGRSSPGERRAWDRWAPLVLLLPGVRRWPDADRRELARVIRLKGGPRESDYSLAFDRHRRLRAAIRRLAASGAG